nr:GNAT family N-acetyltransferase [Microbacterium ulmi]
MRTTRLELSRPVAADVDAIFEACQDAAIQRFTTVPSPYEHRHAEEFVEKVAADWTSGAHATWAIRHGDALAGMIGLYRLDGRGSGELGYWISRGARGRGIVTEASAPVLDWGFAADGLGLARIEWHAVVGNEASARAARTLGFRYEGLRRQALVGQSRRDDGWSAALLATDDRRPQPWPVLGD